MKLRDIHLRDPFIFAENGVYYLYGTRRGPSTKVIPWQGLDVYTSTDLIEWSEPHECFTRPADFWSDRDFFAPEVYHYGDTYYTRYFDPEGSHLASELATTFIDANKQTLLDQFDVAEGFFKACHRDETVHEINVLSKSDITHQIPPRCPGRNFRF